MLTLAAGAASAQPTTQPTAAGLFDPARHMRVSEVRPGMKGYGLSVFKGSKIERFDVEVLSVLKNFNPKYDVILVRCSGADLEHTGSIAGMSGSPIFLKDDHGRYRMCGAFAYGWPLTKDPVGGVQPIEYMLALPEGKGDGSEGGVTAVQPTGARPAEKRIHWSVDDAVKLTRKLASAGNPAPAEEPFSTENAMSLRPLATPMMAAGLSPRLMDAYAPMLRACGLEMMQAGGASGRSPDSTDTAPDVKLEPGSVLAVPLMTGDLNLTAIGTCTEVIGGRVFGFGHAMNNEGAVTLPMGSGIINGIIPNMMTSFKIGEMTQLRGTLGADETVGVAGRIGAKPPTVPVDLHLVYTDGSIDRHFHFDTALHPKLTPMLASVAVSASLTGGRELPQYNTLAYDLDLEFEGGQKVVLKDTAVNTSAQDIFFAIGMPLIAASENPFERVAVKSVSGTLTVSTGARSAQLLSVNLPKSKYKPGQTLRAYVTYRPFRQPEAVMPVEMTLPKDLPEGTYQFRISGYDTYLDDEHQTRPFRFTAESPKEMFDALRDVAAIKHTSVYLRLLRQPDGVAIGRTAMPALPSSRRQVILESGWSNVSPFVSSTTKAIPTQYVMDGAADFEVTIEHDLKTPSAKRPESKGAVLPKAGGPAEIAVPSPPGAGKGGHGGGHGEPGAGPGTGDEP
jgi:hypothetical protein